LLPCFAGASVEEDGGAVALPLLLRCSLRQNSWLQRFPFSTRCQLRDDARSGARMEIATLMAAGTLTAQCEANGGGGSCGRYCCRREGYNGATARMKLRDVAAFVCLLR